MKKVTTLSLMLMGVSISGFSQEKTTAQRPIQFGIKGGVNVSNMTIDDDGTINDKKSIPSWQAGVIVDVPVLPILSLQPGLLLNSKGSKFTAGDNKSDNYMEMATHPLYLELPLNLIVKLPLSEKINLFVGAGPYAAMGIGGKNKTKGKLLGVSFSDEDKIKYSNDDPQTGSTGSSYEGSLKRFDFGLNFLAGVTINYLVLNVNYGYGLTNVKPGSDNDNSKFQNRVFSITAGVLF